MDPDADAHAEREAKRKAKPYQVICISMYHSDIDELEDKVARLRDRGWTNMNKSLLIRIALRHLDAEKLEIKPR
jgi:hypothetical protein